jgi:CheY-like chemotaxis protein
VSARSEGLGHGSEFVIRLPLAQAHVPPDDVPGRPAAAEVEPAPAGVRVLVVDDNTDGAEMVGAALEHLGCVVHVSHDGPSALLAMPGFGPDLGLLDIGLPGMNGYELAGRMRALDPGGALWLVALTGYGQERDFQRSREAGFDEHQVKPMTLERLAQVLHRAREAGKTRGYAPPGTS